MNLIIEKKFAPVFAILFIVKFNDLTLGQNNTDNNSNVTNQIGTYRSIPEATIEDLVSALDSETNSSSIITRTFSQLLEAVADKVQVIFPGTQWCGSGDAAENSTDLGFFDETDTCCKNHDNCPGSLTAGQSIGPLINDGIFTRSTCECDHAFYDCLKDVDTPISAAIGNTYFDLLRPQCYTTYYPIQSCAKNDSTRLINKKCLKYNYDTSANETLEWIDNPDY